MKLNISDLSKQKKIVVAFALVALLIAVSLSSYVLAATYLYNQSNNVSGHGNAPAPTTINTVLTLTPTSWTQGDQITLTATLSQKISGIVVFFYEGTGPSNWVGLGQSVTDVNGVATYTLAGPLGDATYVAQPQQ